jgi:hypothetical protein
MIRIVTPCSRETNLYQLYKSINFDCDWHIVFDKTVDEALRIIESDEFAFLDERWIHVCYAKGGVSGNLQRNLALSNITKGWVYFLDDDNLMHPEFFNTINTLINNYGDVTDCIFFSQQLPNGTIRKVQPDTVKVNFIDQAQFIIKREMIGDLRYVQKYAADGILIQQIFNSNPLDKFYFFNEFPVTYYNRLKWTK